jgi:hypothetical protein
VVEVEWEAEAAAHLDADEAVQGGADDADEVDGVVALDAPAGEDRDQRRDRGGRRGGGLGVVGFGGASRERPTAAPVIAAPISSTDSIASRRINAAWLETWL